MKQRYGFVSNSSSSSFIMLTTLENHNRAMEKMHPYTKLVVEQVVHPTTFLEREIMYYGDLSIMDNSYQWENIKVDWNEDDMSTRVYQGRDGVEWTYKVSSPCEVFDIYLAALNECKSEVFEWSEEG